MEYQVMGGSISLPRKRSVGSGSLGLKLSSLVLESPPQSGRYEEPNAVNCPALDLSMDSIHEDAKAPNEGSS
jgi:hypothetical protein